MEKDRKSERLSEKKVLAKINKKETLDGIKKSKMPDKLIAEVIPEDPHWKSGIDISDDIEKDINIDVHIYNNTSSVITHNSNITINYYNIEDKEATDVRDGSGRMLRKYTVYLLADYISKLDELKKQIGSDDTKLAQEAYELLLKQYKKI